MVETRLRLELFGGLRVRQGSTEAVDWPRQQSGALLGYLALNLHRSCSRDELMAAFWPEDDPEVARHKLRQTLYSIRRQLEELGCDSETVLRASRNTVRLDPASVCTDVSEYEETLNSARQSNDCAQRTELLAHAASLYKGDLLPGFYQDAFTVESNRLSATYLDALHDLMLAYEEAGDLDRAISVARKIVGVNPLEEEAHCDLMRLYAAKGQPSAVLRQFQELERALDEELGEKPSAASRALMESLREGGPRRVAGRANAIASPPALPKHDFTPHRSAASSSLPKARFLLPLAVGVPALAGIYLWQVRHRPAATAGPTAASSAAWPPRKAPEAPFQQVGIWFYHPKPDEIGSEPTQIALDDAGNTYVTGFVHTTKASKRDVDFLTIKYDAGGKLIWSSTYNGPGNDVDRARFIALDKAGNVYVTGESDNGRGDSSKTRLDGTDFATIKYGPDGERSPSWPDIGFGIGVRRYNGPDDGEDWPVSLQVDESGGVYVLGRSWGRGSRNGNGGFQGALVKYGAGGTQEWVARFDSGYGTDTPAGMARDRGGNVYVAITSRVEPPSGPETDILTIKFDKNGDQLWEARYGVNNQTDDSAKAIGLDPDANVYVVGEARGNPGTPDADRKGAISVSYAPNGSLRFVRGTVREEDRISRIFSAKVSGGGAIITGPMPYEYSGIRLRTVLRDSNGLPLWTRNYGLDPDSNPSIDAVGMVIGISDTFLIKNGRQLAVWWYDPQGRMPRGSIYRNPYNVGAVSALALDGMGRPTVAGQSSEDGKVANIVVLKYRP